ncbi:hypothetical protein LAB1_56310 [Roseibium sp. LAB1]
MQDQAQIRVPAGPADLHLAVPVGDPPPFFPLSPSPTLSPPRSQEQEPGSCPFGDRTRVPQEKGEK